MAQLLTSSSVTFVLALLLQADEDGGGIPWWVWFILIAILLLLLLIFFTRQSKPPEPLPKPAERVAPPIVAEEKKEAAEEPVVEEPVEEPKVEPDDLKRIEGIGPKISSVMNEGGIYTFAAMAAATPERLQEILDQASIRLADPGTWPEQARLAAQGEWKALSNFQGQLQGGRRV